MSQSVPLTADVRLAGQIVEQLKAAGIDPDDSDFATLIESECDLQDRLRRMMRAARWAGKQAEALKSMVDEMQERRKRLESREARLKQIVLWALQEAGLPRLDAPDFSATIARGKAPLIVTADASTLPDELCNISREPSKSKLREALEAGTVIEGVSFGNPAPYLNPRFK